MVVQSLIVIAARKFVCLSITKFARGVSLATRALLFSFVTFALSRLLQVVVLTGAVSSNLALNSTAFVCEEISLLKA